VLLISRLSKLGGTGVDSARADLANTIHRSLKDAEQELELLAAQVEDEGSAGFELKVGELTEDLKMFVLSICRVFFPVGREGCADVGLGRRKAPGHSIGRHS
jgi:hypothetical protein